MKTGLIVQARMNSSRTPGKTATDLAGKPLLWHVVMSLKKVRGIDELIVATGPAQKNKWIVEFCRKNKIHCFPYKEEGNVLSRVYHAAKKYKLGQIVHSCADNVFFSTEEYENLIQSHLKTKADYSTNKPTLHPDLGSEITTFATLEKTYREATASADQEHVTTYIYKTAPKKFKINTVAPKLNWPKKIEDCCLCIDYPADVETIRKIVEPLFDGKKPISSNKLINYIQQLQ